MVPHPPGDTGGGYKFSPGTDPQGEECIYVFATPCGCLGRRLQETEHNQMGWTNMVKRRDKLNQYPWAEVICTGLTT